MTKKPVADTTDGWEITSSRLWSTESVKLAADGWEPFAVSGETMWFKRRMRRAQW